MASLLLARRSGTATVDGTASDSLTIIGQPAEYCLPQVQMGPITVGDQGADTGGPPEGLANVGKRAPAAIVRPRDAFRNVDNEVGTCHMRSVARCFRCGPRLRLTPKAPHGSGRGHVTLYVDDELGRKPAPVTKDNCAAYSAGSEVVADVGGG